MRRDSLQHQTICQSVQLNFDYLSFTTVKTEAIRKLSNINFQWRKALYQNNLNNITFFFTFFKGYRCNSLSVITPKKISYEIEAEKINVKFSQMTPYTWNFQNFTCVFKILVKFDIYFLPPWEIFFGIITEDKLHL